MVVPDAVVVVIGSGWVTWVSGSLLVLLRKVTRIETLLNGKNGRRKR
jgi:hypothetical protein